MTAMDAIPPEAFLAAYPEHMAAIAERLRRLVRQARPDAIERVRAGWHLIGYDVPAGASGSRSSRRTAYFGYIAPEHEHVHLGFEHGVAMRDPHGLLEGQGITNQVRWLTFRPGDQIDEASCIELLHEAVRVATMSRAERAFAAMDAASAAEAREDDDHADRSGATRLG
jgi:hypothetical protein